MIPVNIYTGPPVLLSLSLLSISMKRNLNFKMLSLNVRGIRSFDKRKAIFQWLVNEKSDIIVLQETYSTLGV